MSRSSPLAERLKKPVFRDEAHFIRSWLEKPLSIGAVSPSGKALARMMAAPVDPDVPGRVLELGPGTGPVTEALLARGVDEERLILIEYDPGFVSLLRTRFPRATILQGDAYSVRRVLADVQLDGPLAGVVSSLPLLTKPVPVRARLLGQCLNLIRAGAPFSQFTYSVAPPVPLFAIRDASAKGSPVIWRNIPPARVWTYRRPAAV
jgi:phosphatidylethanolamine/phosphatidyl-N-methylethanolamine N-methyltransferase